MKRALIIALIAAPALLVLSYPWRNADDGAGAVMSSIGWFGFLLSLLTVLAVSIALGARKLRTR